MTNDWTQFFPWIVFLVAAPLVFWRTQVARRRMLQNMRQLGERLGLEFQLAEGGNALPRLSGNLCGRLADVFTYTTGSGKHRKTWGVISVKPVMGSALTFTLKKQGLGTKISGLFGTSEITMNDPAFDATWLVQTNQPDFFRAALLPEVREKLMAIGRAGAEGKFEFNGGTVQYVERNRFGQDEGIELFVLLADVVDSLAEIAETTVSAGGAK